MTTQHPGGAGAPDPVLRITLTEQSTVFSGAANLHRYDQPSPREVAQYVRGVLGPHPENATIRITASPADLEQFEQALIGYDVRIDAALLPQQEPQQELQQEPQEGAQEGTQPGDYSEAFPPAEQRRWLPSVIIIVVVVLAAIMCGVVIFRALSPAAQPPAQSAEPAQAGQSAQASSAAAASSPPPANSQPAETPAPVRLAKDGLAIELPAGYQLAEHELGWLATGPDPNMRVVISAENLYHLPAQTLVEQLLGDIERDPETTLVEHNTHAVTYQEISPGGAHTLWRTWSHGTYQLFVGCQTRLAPTRVQEATCRMAFDSAEFHPPEEQSLPQ